MILPATPERAEDLARLNEAFNEFHIDPEVLRERLASPPPTETILLAFVDDRAVGFCCLQIVRSVCYTTPFAEIAELYVEPDHRRSGLATALVREAERRAKAEGAEELSIRVNRSNASALSFYASCGYSGDDLVVDRKL